VLRSDRSEQTANSLVAMSLSRELPLLISINRRRADDGVRSGCFGLAQRGDRRVCGCEPATLDTADGTCSITARESKGLSRSRVATEKLMASLIASEGPDYARIEMIQQ